MPLLLPHMVHHILKWWMLTMVMILISLLMKIDRYRNNSSSSPSVSCFSFCFHLQMFSLWVIWLRCLSHQEFSRFILSTSFCSFVREYYFQSFILLLSNVLQISLYPKSVSPMAVSHLHLSRRYFLLIKTVVLHQLNFFESLSLLLFSIFCRRYLL